jgi:hypothetical protein
MSAPVTIPGVKDDEAQAFAECAKHMTIWQLPRRFQISDTETWRRLQHLRMRPRYPSSAPAVSDLV